VQGNPLTASEELLRRTLVHAPRRYPKVSWTDEAGSHELVIQRRMVLGTAGPVDLVMHDRTVSRVHAELEPSEEGLWIRDLDSRNGTLVGGVKVNQTCIRGSGIVRVGTTTLTIDYAAGVELSVEMWPTDRFHGLVGGSPIMRELFALLARAAPTEASILIRGETGTGKEVVARAIHDSSHRHSGPYVVVDCAALPENLLDAELFGHTKGAFTGAAAARAGAIEAANGGTVFLDEIGELPMSVQPKLLRVLVRRIGESTHRPMDVRFVSATHRDLLAMVARGEFREDLYFRMCVLPVTVPPLRNRREDIGTLVEHFLHGRQLSPELVADFSKMPWRGNVRELRNVVERALALGENVVRQGQVTSTFSDAEPPSAAAARYRTHPPPSSGAASVDFIGRSSLPRLFDHDEGRDGTTPLHVFNERASQQQPPPPSASVPRLLSQPPPPASVAEGDTKPAGRTPTLPESALTGEPVAFEGDLRAFRERWMDVGEREYMRNMLERHQRNIPALAGEAGVNRTYIYRVMRKHGL
jgi:two-component system response regulator GlrR